MSMDAFVLAVGPFKRGFEHYMPYESENYDSVPDGCTVVTTFFQCSTTSQSRSLAALLGITDPWDFTQHKIDPSKVDLENIKVLFDYDEDICFDCEGFAALAEAGFIILYCPEG